MRAGCGDFVTRANEAQSPREYRPYEAGDRVKFERFGEWLEGVIVVNSGDYLTIEYGTHKAVTHRWVESKGVKHAE